VIELFELSDIEAVRFGVSRLREAARLWWSSLSGVDKAGVDSADTLGKAMRQRFQPVTAAHTAREQLDKLAQGGRSVNEYIADFQRLRARLPGMAEEDALFAFGRGLRRDIAIELRKQRVVTLVDAISLASHIGGVMGTVGAVTSGSVPTRPFGAAQMEVDDGHAMSDVIEDRINRAVLNALQVQGVAGAGMGAKSQTHRGYVGERRGGRGGRGGWAGASRGGTGIAIPGVPTSVVEQRRAAGQCFRCGSADHQSRQCPNATSSSQPLN
jgi:hypothetical protein